jgi:hypothetical protein
MAKVPSLQSPVSSPGKHIEGLQTRDDTGLRHHTFDRPVDRKPRTADDVHEHSSTRVPR